MFDPEIPALMVGSMQRIQKAVSSGYYFYVAGTVPAEKTAALVARFDDRFELGASDGQRNYRRRLGRCSFRLVLFPIPQRTDFAFWLLRTEGTDPLLKTEQWRDARVNPITWPFLYELRQTPVPPKLRARYKRPSGHVAVNSVTWTWRFQRDHIEQTRANIRHWVQHRDERLARLVRDLSLAPGFRSVRDDVWHLHQYIVAQCIRRKVSPPALPPRHWVAGKKYATKPLSYLLARARRGAEPWFPQPKKRRIPVKSPGKESENAVAQTNQDRAPEAVDPVAK